MSPAGRRLARVLPLALAAWLAAPAGAAPRPEPAPDAPRVLSVDLRLPPGADRAQLASLLAVAPGDRLSTRALRLTVTRLYQTGRFRNVVVRSVPRGDGVALEIEALPVRVLSALDVRVEPPGPDAASVRSAARLAPGEPFDASDVEAAAERARAALARRGWANARVEGAIEGEDRAVLRVQAGQPVRVRTVRITGKGEAPPLTGRLRSRPGAVLEGEVLDEDVRALRAALEDAGYRRARVGAPVVKIDGSAADVEFPVDAGPRIAFVFRGNQDVSSAVLLRQLGLDAGQAADRPALASAADRIRAFYRARGYAAARVDVEEVPRGRIVAAVFHVEEGRSYRLAEVRLEGVSQRDPAAMRARLRALLALEAEAPSDDGEADRARALVASVPGAVPARATPPPLAPGTAWDEVLWDRAAEQLVDDYRAEGWIDAVYLGSAVSLDAAGRTVTATLRFREGPRIEVEAIAFEGNTAIPLPALAREARLAPGEPLAFQRIEETRAAILRRYLSRGYLYARVDAREQIDRERHAALLRFVVNEGPRVRIGRILVSGNLRTREEVIRRALSVSEGQFYDPDAIARSQGALLGLGVFRSVSLRVHEPEAPQETKDLLVEVSERPYATLAPGVGFSIADGPRAFLEYGRPNLFGRALDLTGRAKVNYPLETFRPDIREKPADQRTFSNRVEGRADVGLRSPPFAVLPLPAATRADLIGEILHRKAYDLRRASGIVGLDAGLTQRVSASLQYELEVDRIMRTGATGILTQADVERLWFSDGVTTLHAVRPTLSLDYRDNSAHPHRGWYASSSLEYAHSLEGALFGVLPGSDIHTNMLKLSGVASAYLPAGAGSVLALSVRGGRVFPLDGRSQTIVPRRFFMGGAASMRGYAEDDMLPQDVRSDLAAEATHCATSPSGIGCTERGRQIVAGQKPISEGGEAFVLGKAELRVPVKGSLEAGLFADVGNLWLDPTRFKLVDLRTNVGFGLRFVTPIGPAALDFGFNVSPDRTLNEATFAPHFSIGLF